MKLSAKLDDLIAETLYPVVSPANDYNGRNPFSKKNVSSVVDKHIDVHEDEGYITIPRKELPDDWSDKSDMSRFKSLDRPFVFPGEQVHIMACLLPCEQEEDRTELLMRFKNSHFFARIAEVDEALWTRKKPQESFQDSGKFIPIESSKDDMAVDRGSLDASTSGGVAKNDVKCSLLANGDIVVLLQINTSVDYLTNPLLEILQFERYESSSHLENDPYGDLLKWLLPIQNSISPPRFLSPPITSPSSSARNSLTKPNSPSSFGSHNFLLGQFKSHSMSSLISNSVSPSTLSTPDKSLSEKSGEGLLSFRGVSLEPERFSVRCGLEGIYFPGRRWRRKIEIIQPLEIHCFATDCNTEDIICVQIKNVSPTHAPDIVIYLDAITVIFEEASKTGPPLSFPIACIEAGNDQGLPNLPLRIGEEHSFILKPTMQLWSSNAGSAPSSVHIFTNVDCGDSSTNKYAVIVSCRCNYTESKLLFKQPTSWRPRIQKGILISVASQMSRKTHGPDDKIPNLPVQVLTLQASNLTNDDLTLTLLAPSLLTSPTVLSLNCSPPSSMSPMSPLDDNRQSTSLNRLYSASKVLDQRSGEEDDCVHTPVSFNEKTVAISDVRMSSNLGRTHMWLKSIVPLGCVPSRSTVTVKLELLPLTDGIITLDSLRINVEKGPSYIPAKPLKINATSSIRIGAL